MYRVVSSVTEYKKFVPWCVDSHVLLSQPRYMEAELSVGFQLFSERYLSRVTLEPGTRVIARARDTQLFSHLTNEWHFSPGPTTASTWLTFSVDFQFRSVLYSQAASVFFDEVVAKMVGAFEKRCAAVWEAERAQRNAAAVAPARASDGSEGVGGGLVDGREAARAASVASPAGEGWRPTAAAETRRGAPSSSTAHAQATAGMLSPSVPRPLARAGAGAGAGGPPASLRDALVGVRGSPDKKRPPPPPPPSTIIW